MFHSKPCKVEWWEWCTAAFEKANYQKNKDPSGDSDALLEKFKGITNAELKPFLEEACLIEMLN